MALIDERIEISILNIAYKIWLKETYPNTDNLYWKTKLESRDKIRQQKWLKTTSQLLFIEEANEILKKC